MYKLWNEYADAELIYGYVIIASNYFFYLLLF